MYVLSNEAANLPKGGDAKLKGLRIEFYGSQLPKGEFFICNYSR